MKIKEGVDAKIPGDEVDSGVSDAQIGGGSKKDESPLAAVGHRYALDGTIKQITFVSDKHFSDLDDYLEHLRVKLTSTFHRSTNMM